MTIGIGAPKPRRQSEKNTILKHFLKGLLEGKLLAPKLRKSADKSLSQPWCSHSNTIYVIQLNIHAAITMRFAASHGLPACIYAHGNRAWQQSCSHSNAICNQSFKKCIKLRKQEQTLVAEHRGGTNSRMTIRCRTQRRNQFAHETTPAAPAARTRYLSSPAAATLHGKTQGFVSCSRFLPKTKPMQHSCSHYNAFCSITWLTRMYLRTWQQSMTIIMQPFQCDLQPELQETNYAHRNNHSLQNTEEEPIRAWNDPIRTSRTHEVPFIAGCSHFARKNPKQSPCNIHAAITMRFAASRGLPACIYADGNRAWQWQQSCSHSNAICNQSFKKRIKLRKQEQTLVAKHRGGTNSRMTIRCRIQRRNQFAHETTPAAPAARRRYLSSPAAATLHGKTQGFVSCSRFLPKTKPMQHSCSHYNAFCSITWLTR